MYSGLKKLLSLALALLLVSPGGAAFAAASGGAPLDKLAHRVAEGSAPAVYFTKDVSAAGLLKIYEALGRAPQGKVGIKLTFESPGGPYLSPALLKALRDRVNGTFIDSNGLTPPRNSTEGHLRVAADHGFTAVGPVDILDAEGELDMPVTNGKHLKYHRTGSHFADYDSVISVVRFKSHHIENYGGTLKNLTICLASISGKCNLHSAGRTSESYSPAASDEDFLEALADGVKAALDYKKDRWVFINVLSAIEPDDSCANTTPLGDIGILASLDPVAADQAAVDITFGAAPSSAVREEWERTHNTRLLGYAEAAGAGRRNYRLLSID